MYIEYKIIGGDGREYGPVPLDELKTWILDGRVGPATMVWGSESSTWHPAIKYAEFQPELGGIIPPQTRPTPPPVSESFRPVGFFPRLWAFIIDQFWLVIVFYFVWAIILGREMPTFDEKVQDLNLIMKQWMENADKMMPIYLAIYFSYEVLFNGKFGATLGKMAIGAKIVRTDLSPLGFGFAALRWLASRISQMIFYVGYFLIFFRPDKRALHDLIAGTRVIYKR